MQNCCLRVHVLQRLVQARDGSYSRKVPLVFADDERARACWNGSTYQCDACDSAFPTRQAVLEHLRSPVHDDKIYKCKRSGDWDGCGKEYPTLGALLQHVDGECRDDDNKDEIDECLEDALRASRIRKFLRKARK